MQTTNNYQSTKVQELPFWKERSFILGAVPVAGSVLATYFDYTFLRNYEIPAMYAEMNFFATAYISIVLITCLTLVISIIGLSIELEKSSYIIPKLFFRPFALIGCMFLWFVTSVTNQDTSFIYFLYSISVIGIFWDAYSDKADDKSFIEKLHSAVERTSSVVNTSDKNNSKADNVVKIILVSLLAFLLLTITCAEIAKNIDVWILSNKPSTIAIKRSNFVYILKEFNPDTMILEDGFTIIQVGEKPLKLTPMKNHHNLISKSLDKYRKKTKEEKLKSKLETKELIKSIEYKVKTFKSFIMGENDKDLKANN